MGLVATKKIVTIETFCTIFTILLVAAFLVVAFLLLVTFLLVTFLLVTSILRFDLHAIGDI